MKLSCSLYVIIDILIPLPFNSLLSFDDIKYDLKENSDEFKVSSVIILWRRVVDVKTVYGPFKKQVFVCGQTVFV